MCILGTLLLLAACDNGVPSPPILGTTSSSPTTTTGIPSTAAPGAQATPGAPGIGDPLFPELGNGGYDVVSYAVDLDYQTDGISVELAIEANATQNLSELSLDFIGFQVESVRVNGTEATFSRTGHELVITLPESVATAAKFIINVSYHGQPTTVSTEAIPILIGWRRTAEGVNYIASEPDGTRSWLPTNDHPLDKARYTFRLTVPTGLLAAANGVLVETIPGPQETTYVWEQRQPMATYLATLVIGDLELVEMPGGPVPIRHVLPKRLADDPPEELDALPAMIEFMEERVGPYPFDAYGVALVEGFEIALENQTLSLFGPSFLREEVVIHELAHQWFGDSVSLTAWDEIWLNEGFATYFQWLWLAEQEGQAAFEDAAREFRGLLTRLDPPPPARPPADDLFNPAVYGWGALVLHAYRQEVGDELFFATIREYYARHAGGNASTEDLVAAAEAITGREWSTQFEEWLGGEEPPPM